jgi:hypothetical protein
MCRSCHTVMPLAFTALPVIGAGNPSAEGTQFIIGKTRVGYQAAMDGWLEMQVRMPRTGSRSATNATQKIKPAA